MSRDRRYPSHTGKEKSQIERFKEAARELGADDEDQFNERLKRIVKDKPKTRHDQRNPCVTVTGGISGLGDDLISSRRRLRGERGQVFFDLVAQRRIVREGQLARTG